MSKVLQNSQWCNALTPNIEDSVVTWVFLNASNFNNKMFSTAKSESGALLNVISINTKMVKFIEEQQGGSFLLMWGWKTAIHENYLLLNRPEHIHMQEFYVTGWKKDENLYLTY